MVGSLVGEFSTDPKVGHWGCFTTLGNFLVLSCASPQIAEERKCIPLRGWKDIALNILFCIFLFIFCFIRVSYAGIYFLLVKLLIVSKYLSQVGVPLKLTLLVYWGPDLSTPGVDHRLHLLPCRTESLEAESEGLAVKLQGDEYFSMIFLHFNDYFC